MVNRNEVIAAYWDILKRMPENEAVVAGHAAHYQSPVELRAALQNSQEYLSRTSLTPLLPASAMTQVCNFSAPIRIVEPESTDGNISLVELVLLNQLVAERSPAVIFELGTFDGRTTLNLAANAPAKAKVFTIDLPRSQLNMVQLELDHADRKYIDKESSGRRFKTSEYGARITQLFGDTATFDFSPWRGQVDLIFVDASHAAPYVRNDTEVALGLIGGRDGLIAWHDYSRGWPGVAQVLEEYYKTDSRLKNLTYIRGTSLAICKLA